MTLRKKTLLMVAIVLPTYLVAISFLVLTSSRASHAVSSFSAKTYVLDKKTQAIETDFGTFDGQMNAYVLAAATTPGPLVTQSLANARAADALVRQDISQVQKLGAGDAQIAKGLTGVSTGLTMYEGYVAKVISAASAGKYHLASEIQSVYNNNATNTLNSGITTLQAAIATLVHSKLSQVTGMQNLTVVLALITGVLILVAMIGSIGVFMRGVMAPIYHIVTEMRAISGNQNSKASQLDLTRRLRLKRNDELGELGDTLDNLLDSVTTAVEQISKGSRSSSLASEQLSVTSSLLSDSVDSTVERVTQISASARQVGDNVGMVAENTKQMHEAIQEISRGTSSATQVALKAVASAGTAVSVISRLGESSKMIETVVQVITSIAEQTNLLALNATIEAARAGQAGKGFAVVASEVKDLAKKTSEATGEISKMITTIQGDTARAVNAIDDISTIISQINDLQASIASAVEEQSVTTAEIGNSIENAARSASDIAIGITEVEHGTQDAKKISTETKIAASDLAQLADSLSILVQKFHINASTIEKPVDNSMPRRPRFGVEQTNTQNQQLEHIL